MGFFYHHARVDKAELRACLAGIYICITIHKPIALETGCSFVASFLAKETIDRFSSADLKKGSEKRL